MRYAWLFVILLTSTTVIGEDVHQTCPFHKEKSTTGDHQNCPMHQNHKSEELESTGRSGDGIFPGKNDPPFFANH